MTDYCNDHCLYVLTQTSQATLQNHGKKSRLSQTLPTTHFNANKKASKMKKSCLLNKCTGLRHLEDGKTRLSCFPLWMNAHNQRHSIRNIHHGHVLQTLHHDQHLLQREVSYFHTSLLVWGMTRKAKCMQTVWSLSPDGPNLLYPSTA